MNIECYWCSQIHTDVDPFGCRERSLDGSFHSPGPNGFAVDSESDRGRALWDRSLILQFHLEATAARIDAIVRTGLHRSTSSMLHSALRHPSSTLAVKPPAIPPTQQRTRRAGGRRVHGRSSQIGISLSITTPTRIPGVGTKAPAGPSTGLAASWLTSLVEAKGHRQDDDIRAAPLPGHRIVW